MGWVSESNPETRNLVARKVRREIPKDIADQMVNGEIGKAIVNLYSVGGAIMKIDKNGIRDLSLLESFGAIKDEDPPLKMKEAIDV